MSANQPDDILLHADSLHVLAAHGNGVDLECRRGSVTVITGASARETTLWLEALALLRPPARGHIRLLDCRNDDDDARIMALRQKVGYVDAASPLVSALSVRMNVMLPGLYHRSESRAAARAAADRVLDRLGYNGQRDKSPAQLTALENHHALLARALVLDPAVVFIDEPFRMSIITAWTAIGVQLRSLAHEDKRAILVATRNLAFAAACADQFVFVDDDHASVQANWSEFSRAERPAAFINASPFVSGLPER